MAVSPTSAERIYREYMSFFEKAEKHRRWSVFDDIPWDKLDGCPRDPLLARCAETFCGVEMYLPDYVAQGINQFRECFGRAWFLANWGYEESKHALALREYLRRSGQRTDEQIAAFEREILGKQWKKPFGTARQITLYGIIQELTTYVFYKKHKALAQSRGDEVLAAIYGLVARDEIAHFGFYASATRVLLEEDRDGTKRDLAHVFRNFTMPAYDLVPEYDDRVQMMRQAGMDHRAFIAEVWLPALKAVGVNRAELVGLDRRGTEPGTDLVA
ncbi:MAG TPA: acyl-ACP desaturase [Kofleriaceae bacterium]|nr:acyl-ACP desaturase [Kofleriaceae bacterium]